jgi:catechol 2,3-dioxygenase-like lactoylglutathione lyase family enzyme
MARTIGGNSAANAARHVLPADAGRQSARIEEPCKPDCGWPDSNHRKVRSAVGQTLGQPVDRLAALALDTPPSTVHVVEPVTHHPANLLYQAPLKWSRFWSLMMQLGAFSISLAVKDLAKSKAFYEKLGFSKVEGDEEQNWLVLKNGSTVIGLFQGMFEKNILTFNPGWDQGANPLERFTDIRQLQADLKTKNVHLESEVDEKGSGPGSFVVIDPDGNPILVDQHR